MRPRALRLALHRGARAHLRSDAEDVAQAALLLFAWLFAFQRGHLLLRGAVYGLAGGIGSSLVPLSVLRPCCEVGEVAGPDCCTMPGACLAAGALVGVLLAGVVPRRAWGRRDSTPGVDVAWLQSALGLVLGMTSVAALRCASLFAGEAAGLVAGLVGGVLASAAARRWLSGRAAA